MVNYFSKKSFFSGRKSEPDACKNEIVDTFVVEMILSVIEYEFKLKEGERYFIRPNDDLFKLYKSQYLSIFRGLFPDDMELESMMMSLSEIAGRLFIVDKPLVKNIIKAMNDIYVTDQNTIYRNWKNWQDERHIRRN